jgi:methyltransferase (TIGR00027 family)
MYGMTDSTDVFSGPALTALGLAASRTVESGRPDRLIDDPLARVFFEAADVSLPMRLDWPTPGEITTGTERLHLHGSRYIGLRTRVYDDVLLAAAEGGIRQGVLIGAGLDSRAFRLALPADFHVIELDRKPLLEWKETVLETEGVRSRCRRSWIGADLRGAWSSELPGSGFDAGAPTVLIAEGVLPYLTPGEQAHFLAELDSIATADSVLALDRIVHDRHSGNRIASLSRRSGLDMTELLAPGESNGIVAALQDRGWTVREIAVEDIATSYGRDLSDPFSAADVAGEPAEPPWLETRILHATSTHRPRERAALSSGPPA